MSEPENLGAVLIAGLGAFRLTRLIQADDLFDVPRCAILNWLAAKRRPWADKTAEGLTCPWCLSAHMAAAILILRRRRFPRLADLLAVAAVAGLLAHLEAATDG